MPKVIPVRYPEARKSCSKTISAEVSPTGPQYEPFVSGFWLDIDRTGRVGSWEDQDQGNRESEAWKIQDSNSCLDGGK